MTKDIPCEFCGKVSSKGRCKSCSNKQRIITDEWHKNISISQTGRKHTEETKRKQSLSKLGKKMSEEARLNMSKAFKGRLAWNKGLTILTNPRIRNSSNETRKKQSEAHKGFEHTEKTKRLMSEGHKGKVFSEEHKNNISLGRKEMFITNPELKQDFSNTLKRTWQTHRDDFVKKAKENMSNRDRCSVCGKLLGKEHSCKNPFQGKTHTRKVRDMLSNNMKIRRVTEVFPKKDTSIEIKIQNQLRELGYDFFTHQYMKEIEHRYQCDILIPSLNLVIECDGNYWHKYPVGNDIDHIRTSELVSKGFKVLRLWELDIRKMSLDDLRNKILKVV